MSEPVGSAVAQRVLHRGHAGELAGMDLDPQAEIVKRVQERPSAACAELAQGAGE